MNRSKPLCVTAIVASLYLSACASTGPSNTNAPYLASADQSAAAVGSAAIGDTISLAEGNPTGASTADIIAEYFAASNRRCRQVLPRGGQAVRIACEHRDGQWRWVRALTTSQVAQPLPALVTVGAALPTELSSAPSVEDEYRINVEPGETLWGFSQRTTGSGVHWEAIAELNDIDDARTVTSAMSLLVPSHLVIGQ